MIASVATAFINVGLNYLFIKLYGYIAAGFTTLACFMVYAFAHYLFSSHIAKKQCDCRSVYNNKYILVLSASIVVLSGLIMLLYDFWYIRYIFVLIVLVLSLVFRKKIVEVFAQLRKKSEQNEENS